jgi:hypothetical protein
MGFYTLGAIKSLKIFSGIAARRSDVAWLASGESAFQRRGCACWSRDQETVSRAAGKPSRVGNPTVSER